MMYTADYLIKKRKEKWEELHDIEYDRKLREAIADEIIKNRTIEKLNVLELLLSHKIIDEAFYTELSERVKSDYNTSYLYLLGLVSLD